MGLRGIKLSPPLSSRPHRTEQQSNASDSESNVGAQESRSKVAAQHIVVQTNVSGGSAQLQPRLQWVHPSATNLMLCAPPLSLLLRRVICEFTGLLCINFDPAPNRFRWVPVVITAALLGAVGGTPPSTAVPELPTLRQLPRSDWHNVKTGCNSTHQAKGDGKTDDTAAIQACFDMLSSPTGSPVGGTVFIPAGQYVITSTLKLFKVLGGTVLGTGETSVLIWKGKKGGNSTIIWSDGISRSRMLGFVLDGREGADVGIDHWSNHSLFGTTRVPLLPSPRPPLLCGRGGCVP